MSAAQFWKSLLFAGAVGGMLSSDVRNTHADLINVGTTYFADNLEDDTVGNDPNGTSGLVSLASFGAGSSTRVRVDPTDALNQVLRSDPTTISGTTGKRYRFSAAMAANQPSVGTFSYRVYLDQIDTGYANVSAPTSLLDVPKADNGSTSKSNMAFSLKLEAVNNKFQFVTSGQTHTVTDLVADEWIDVSIDYDLTSTANNVELTLSSPTIGSSVTTYSSDLTGLVAAPIRTFWTFNRAGSSGVGGTGHNIYAIDDISWTAVSAVPEPSSVAFFSLAAAAVFVKRRKTVS